LVETLSGQTCSVSPARQSQEKESRQFCTAEVALRCVFTDWNTELDKKLCYGRGRTTRLSVYKKACNDAIDEW